MLSQKENAHSIKQRILRVKNDIIFLNLIKEHTEQGYICGLPGMAMSYYIGNVLNLMKMLKNESVIKEFRKLRQNDEQLRKACFDGNPLIDKNAVYSSPVIWTVDKKKLESLLAKKSNELSRLEEQMTRGAPH